MPRLARALSLVVFAVALAGCGLVGGTASPAPGASGSSDALSQGLAAHTAGKLDEAVGLYHQVLSRDPSNKFAYFNLGQIAHTRNQIVAAESWYRLALESDPKMPSALYNLALVRQSVGDSVESASLLRRLITLDPNNASAHYNLGVALRALGQTADATTEFATAQRLDSRLVPPSGSPARPSPTR
jgi:tetratricopeptide (TPR) repeat protein